MLHLLFDEAGQNAFARVGCGQEVLSWSVTAWSGVQSGNIVGVARPPATLYEFGKLDMDK